MTAKFTQHNGENYREQLNRLIEANKLFNEQDFQIPEEDEEIEPNLIKVYEKLFISRSEQ